jgi:hypothetical protein
MVKPSNFNTHSGYATMKNDDTGTVSVTFPASTVVTAVTAVTNDLVIGTINASSRVSVASSKEGNVYYTGSQMVVSRTGTVPGPISSPYTLAAYLTRVNATTVRATAVVSNPYGVNLTTSSGDETFTFEIGTFLSPFV